MNTASPADRRHSSPSLRAGCASQEQQQANANQSTIPWNRPQSWEGGGMLGGFNPGPQGSTGH